MLILIFSSALILILVLVCALYLWIIALAGIRTARVLPRPFPATRFAVVIPAHNEETVIGQTVETLLQMDYPRDLFHVFVVADFCTDSTAEIARQKGATCFERTAGERGGKGPAVSYLLEQVFASGAAGDAIIVFDADTRADPNFLKLMDARLAMGDQVIQGQHVISNPHAAWFPALTWAMVVIDNRFSNQGRANLGLSARHMGDSICFRSDILKRLGWGSGLTEDFELRLRLLMEGIVIRYEPAAVGYGQASLNLREAQAQRMRWARGVADAGSGYYRPLLRAGLQQRDWSKLDGAIGVLLPSYTTLTFISLVMLFLQVVLGRFTLPGLTYLWAGVVAGWLFYPLFGLILGRAPWWAYLAILSGPLFMLWRTWLRIKMRLFSQPVAWVRTTHRG